MMIPLTRKASLIALGAALLAVSTFQAPSAQARGWAVANGNGAAGGWGHRFSGPNGGRFAGGGGAIANGNGGVYGRRFSALGANGSYAQGGAAAGWKRGVGAVEGSRLSMRGPGGSTYNGYTGGGYNAQTGNGAFNSSRQVYDAKNGQNYGYTNNSTYARGQGGQTQIDTDHHGDYTVDWGNGQRPVVVQDPAGAQ